MKTISVVVGFGTPDDISATDCTIGDGDNGEVVLASMAISGYEQS